MPLAVLEIGLGPALDVEVQEHLEVVVAHTAPVADGPGEAGQVVHQRIAPPLLELLRQVVGPGQAAGREDVGLVGKHAGNVLAELLAHLAAIRLQCDLDEFLGHAGVDQVHVTAARVPRRVRRANGRCRQVLALRERLAGAGVGSDVGRAALGEAKHGEHVGGELAGAGLLAQLEAAAPRLGHCLRHVPAREARRVGVLVVHPDVHVERLGLAQGRLPEAEPVGREVGRHQPRLGMDPDLPHLLPGQVAKRQDDLLLREQIVPGP